MLDRCALIAARAAAGKTERLNHELGWGRDWAAQAVVRVRWPVCYVITRSLTTS